MIILSLASDLLPPPQKDVSALDRNTLHREISNSTSESKDTLNVDQIELFSGPEPATPIAVKPFADDLGTFKYVLATLLSWWEGRWC